MWSQAKEGTTANSSSSAAPAFEIHDDATDLVSKLPTREGWSEPLVLYKNYWFRPNIAANIIRVQNSFKPRHDDCILAVNPKCGTTWTKALAFAITNRSRYEFGNNHPLLFRHPQEVVPFMEIPFHGDAAYVEALPSPRLLTTHIPLSLFPKSIADWGCRVVYMCREPKDAFISRWHFENKVFRERDIDLETTFSLFSEGFSAYGPFLDHCLEYWKESLTRPDKVLFLKYEDVRFDPLKYVIKLATFLGVPFSTEEEEEGIPEAIVRLCSFEKLSSLQANQTGEIARRGNTVVLEKSAFFRKGKVGDWANHISEDMARKFDSIVEDKLKGSGLVF
jgi:estrone sulfotransferase